MLRQREVRAQLHQPLQPLIRELGLPDKGHGRENRCEASRDDRVVPLACLRRARAVERGKARVARHVQHAAGGLADQVRAASRSSARRENCQRSKEGTITAGRELLSRVTVDDRDRPFNHDVEWRVVQRRCASKAHHGARTGQAIEISVGEIYTQWRPVLQHHPLGSPRSQPAQLRRHELHTVLPCTRLELLCRCKLPPLLPRIWPRLIFLDVLWQVSCAEPSGSRHAAMGRPTAPTPGPTAFPKARSIGFQGAYLLRYKQQTC